MADNDLVVRGGSVIDGTGASARIADVAVRDGVITEVGVVDGAGRREIDVDGALVTPGFVDIHCHYDGQATWDAHLQPSSWHGVTTIVMGNCGVGFAPVHDADHDRLIELMEGVEDIPGAALHEGLTWGWHSFGEYLDATDTAHDMDFAAQVPHGALRLHVMGERGAAREEATPDDIAAMGTLAADAIRAGALGFSTSRTRNHRTSRGEFTPTLTAEQVELVGIAEAVGATGAGVLQLVSDFVDVDAEFAIVRSMAERSGRPLSLSLAQSPVVPDQYKRLLELIAVANADGVTITGQCAPRPVGILLGLDLTLNPFMNTATWKRLRSLPMADRVAALHDPTVRAELITDGTAERDREKLAGGLVTKFETLFEIGSTPDYEPSLRDSIAARARRAGVEPAELALDLLLADDGQGMLYLPFLNYVDGGLESTREMLAHPNTVPGLGDGGAHVGTICDGSFPTTLLTHWGRDRPEGRFPVEYLVQQQSRDTARTVGLFDRGVIAPGYRADLNVLDFDSLGVRRPEIAHDLPAGGRRLLQRADGYLHTICSGIETYASGESTGELPGRLVRGAQPAPGGTT